MYSDTINCVVLEACSKNQSFNLVTIGTSFVYENCDAFNCWKFAIDVSVLPH